MKECKVFWRLRIVFLFQFCSVQSLSHVWLFATPWTAACQASQSLLKLMSIELVMPSNHLILCRPLLLLPSIFPSIRVFSKESVLLIRRPKYWSFSFSFSPSNEDPGLISFRMDWLDLLAVQGTLKSLLQHHTSKASILQCSTLFIVQLPHPYMTTGKTIALTRWTFVGKVMSLSFNKLFRLVITFLPRSKLLLILWLQSPSAVILEPKKIQRRKKWTLFKVLNLMLASYLICPGHTLGDTRRFGMVGDQDLILCEVGLGCQRELMNIASKDPKTFFPVVYMDMEFYGLFVCVFFVLLLFFVWWLKDSWAEIRSEEKL